MNAKEILARMKEKSSGGNSNSTNNIPVIKLPFGEKILVKIIRDTKTPSEKDPFIANALHIKNALIPQTAQCNTIFEDSECPLCELDNDDEWNNFRWEMYNNGNRDVWKLMMGTRSKWMTQLLVVPVNEIYKTSPSSELHRMFLWEKEVQDFLEQYIVLNDEIKKNINKTYFYVTRMKTKQGYRLKLEPAMDNFEKLSKERIAILKKELEQVPAMKERINIPEKPLDKKEQYFKVIKPIKNAINSLSETLDEYIYNTIVNIVDRIFEPYMIDETALEMETEKEEEDEFNKLFPKEEEVKKVEKITKRVFPNKKPPKGVDISPSNVQPDVQPKANNMNFDDDDF